MRRRPIDHKRGPIDDRILKFVVYGDQQMHATKIKNWGNKENIKGFFKGDLAGHGFPRKNYIRGNEIKEVATDVRFRRKLISTLKETGDFGESEFYGFRGAPEENKDRRLFWIGVN